MRKPKKAARTKMLGLKVTATQHATFTSLANGVTIEGRERTITELMEELLGSYYGAGNVRSRKAGPIAKTPTGVIRLLLAEALVRLSQEATAIAESVADDPRSAEEIAGILRNIDAALVEIAQQAGLRTVTQSS